MAGQAVDGDDVVCVLDRFKVQQERRKSQRAQAAKLSRGESEVID
jgi:hypothetical protein